MSLDVYLEEYIYTDVYHANITHNLGAMADAAGIYKHLWRPDELTEVAVTEDLIAPLEAGLAKLKENPDEYRKYNAVNGWGIYENFVCFVEKYLKACKAHPMAKVRVSR